MLHTQRFLTAISAATLEADGSHECVPLTLGSAYEVTGFLVVIDAIQVAIVPERYEVIVEP